MALNFPNSPTEGQIYTDTPSGNRWVWDSANTVWKSTSTFTQTITVASTAPGSPVIGQLWWNQDYGRLLVYYSDGTSSQWVDASPSDYTSGLAYGQANAAYSKANLSFQNTTGTLAGSLTTTGSLTSNGYLYVTPVGGDEGGEIQLSATGYNTSWSMDSYQNTFRVFARSGSTVSNVNFFHATGGSVRMGIGKTDPAYTLDVAGELSTSSRGITKASMPSGSILQVLQTTKTDVFSTSSTSYTDVTGMSVNITPTSSSSKILIIGGISFGPSTTAQYAQFGRLVRNGSAIFIADAAGNRDRGTFSFQEGGFEGPLSLHFNYIDSPGTTSQVTYGIQIRAESPQTAYINRGVENDGDSSITPRAVSSITVMEIAQ
jgi:hypothetical protein